MAFYGSCLVHFGEAELMTRCRRIVGSLDGGGWKSPMAEFLLRGDLELSIFKQNFFRIRIRILRVPCLESERTLEDVYCWCGKQHYCPPRQGNFDNKFNLKSYSWFGRSGDVFFLEFVDDDDDDDVDVDLSVAKIWRVVAWLQAESVSGWLQPALPDRYGQSIQRSSTYHHRSATDGKPVYTSACAYIIYYTVYYII